MDSPQSAQTKSNYTMLCTIIMLHLICLVMTQSSISLDKELVFQDNDRVVLFIQKDIAILCCDT